MMLGDTAPADTGEALTTDLPPEAMDVMAMAPMPTSAADVKATIFFTIRSPTTDVRQPEAAAWSPTCRALARSPPRPALPGRRVVVTVATVRASRTPRIDEIPGVAPGVPVR